MTAYPTFVKDVFNSYMSGLTVKAMLVAFYDQSLTDEFLSDVSSYEISASGYNKQTLGGVTVNTDPISGNMFITCADINFGTFTFSQFQGPMFYIDTGTPSTSRLLGFVDGGPFDAHASVATIYRVDPDQGIFLGAIQP